MTYEELIQKLKQEGTVDPGDKVLQVDPEGNPVPGSEVTVQ
jgi:hypothetical protein